MRVWWMIFIEEGQFLLHWLYIGVHMIVQHVLDMQALALNEEWENTLILSICFESMKMRDRNVWVLERNVGFTSRLLLDSSRKRCSSKDFVYVIIHYGFSCEKFGPYMQRKNTHTRETILIESRVVMSLQRLETGYTLCIIREVYGVDESIISINWIF